MKKMSLISIGLAFAMGCNVNVSEKNIVYQIKSEKPAPQILTFESKVIYQGIESVFDLPVGNFAKLNLSTNIKRNDKESIKIPENGEFRIIFDKTSQSSGNSLKVNVTDNDATDGEAVVQMPDTSMEGFLRLFEQQNSKSTDTMNMEDKLYFTKNDLKVINPGKGEKEKWYRLGKKSFPIPENWHNDDGTKYILRFKNTGIKKGEFRWFKTDKPELPMNMAEITPEKGGTIDFKGIGTLKFPPESVTEPQIITMKEEFSAYEYIGQNLVTGNWEREYDYVSPVVRLEPFGLKLNKPAKVRLELNMERIGNNSIDITRLNTSKNKENWEYAPGHIWELEYTSEFMWAFVPPNHGLKIFISEPAPFSTNNFRIKDLYTKHFAIISNYNNAEMEIGKRAETYLYPYYKQVAGTEPKVWYYAKNEDKYYVPISYDTIFSKYYTKTALTQKHDNEKLPDGTKASVGEIYINGGNLWTLEHELWHLFQISLFPDKYGTGKGVNNWWIEGSAEYMGAKAFDKNASANLVTDTQNTELNYSTTLTDGYDSIDLREPFPLGYFVDSTVLNRVSSTESYKNWSFFAYLSHADSKKTGNDLLGSDKILTNKFSDNSYLNKFHDYMVYGITSRKRLDISRFKSLTYPQLTQINLNNLDTILNQKIDATIDSKPKLINKSLSNLTGEFYKITLPNDNKFKGSSLGIKLKNRCNDNLKISALFYNNKVINGNPTNSSDIPQNFIIHPQFASAPLDNVVNRPSVSKDGVVTLNKVDKWYYFSDYKDNFDYVVLVASYSNGNPEDKSTCSYEIATGYCCISNSKPLN